jgi:hypothetical protein
MHERRDVLRQVEKPRLALEVKTGVGCVEEGKDSKKKRKETNLQASRVLVLRTNRRKLPSSLSQGTVTVSNGMESYATRLRNRPTSSLQASSQSTDDHPQSAPEGSGYATLNATTETPHLLPKPG